MTALRCLLLVWAIGFAAAAPAAGFSGLALVDDDATLRIRGQRVALWGVYVPETATDCTRFERPPRCASRAALALERAIEGFVRCERVARLDDGTVVARCHSGYSAFDDGIDLGAWLVNRGWALALPEAPPAYRVGELAARRHGLGIWGLPLVLTP